jgi:hypothetical protein
MPLTDTILMVEPTHFGFNAQTAASNSFQKELKHEQTSSIQEKALLEFHNCVKKLKAAGIQLIVVSDEVSSNSPDSIFPNNWFSTHRSKELFLYPMLAENRRMERSPFTIELLQNSFGFKPVDLSFYETQDTPKFLEGTGSMVLDRSNQLAYAALSPRTNETVLLDFCKHMDYSPITFEATGPTGEAIYHTNVMMSMGMNYCIIALESIVEKDRTRVIDHLLKTDKEIVEISLPQTYQHFAGNMIQLKNEQSQTLLVLSESAYHSLKPNQLEILKKHNDRILPLSIPTIEKHGGGSIRCMIAEIFKPY